MRPRGDLVRLCVLLLLVGGTAACSGTSPSSAASSAATGTTGGQPATSQPAREATTTPVRWTATITGEHEVSPGYRQGLARDDGGGQGWVFSTNNGLYRTDGAFQQGAAPTDKAELVIPADLVQQGYNHIGDIDIAGGVLWAPIEKDDKSDGKQVMARFDAPSLRFVDSYVVPQHHNSFVAVGPDGVLYSTDQFDDDTLVRYRYTGSALEPIEPVRMNRRIGHIQGADIDGGAAWLSTDDDQDGLYRVDLATGAVQDLGSMGHADGEGEGIDAQPGQNGGTDLHPLSIDAKLVPVRVIDVSAAPAAAPAR